MVSRKGECMDTDEDAPGEWTLLDRDDYGFRWRWASSKHKALIQWEAHLIAGRHEGHAIYADERHTSSDQAFESPSYVPIEEGHILRGTSKFDGCTDIQQSQTDCMMHFCNSADFVEIAKDIHGLGKVFLEERGDGWE